MTNVSDTELVARAAAGDADAFGEFFSRHWAWAVRMARMRYHDLATAEDLAATAFLHAWRGLRTWRDTGSLPTTWLAVILRNACHEHARRLSYRPAETFWQPDLDDVSVDPCDTPEAEVTKAERLADLERALRSLTTAQQLALDAVIGADCSVQAAADRLGLPYATLRHRLRRARQKLRANYFGVTLRPKQKRERGGAPGRPLTLRPEESARIVALRSAGLTWTDIEREVGRSRSCCRRAVERAERAKERIVA